MHTGAFDDLANDYDAIFTDTAIGRVLRDLVWARMNTRFGDCRCVLELGCGTGEDAVQLARGGVRVVATDASAEMIRIAQHKALLAGCLDRIAFHCVEMEQLGHVLEGMQFDGVLSNFGAVNCARDFPNLVADVASRLRPGGTLLWVVMGRYVPWEWAWFLLHGRWRAALRRLTPGGVRWRGVTVSYPRPQEMLRWLRPYFRVDRISPLGFALPPSYAGAWLARSPHVLTRLAEVERRGQRWSALAHIADHYVVEGTRLSVGSGARAGPSAS